MTTFFSFWKEKKKNEENAYLIGKFLLSFHEEIEGTVFGTTTIFFGTVELFEHPSTVKKDNTVPDTLLYHHRRQEMPFFLDAAAFASDPSARTRVRISGVRERRTDLDSTPVQSWHKVSHFLRLLSLDGILNKF